MTDDDLELRLRELLRSPEAAPPAEKVAALRERVQQARDVAEQRRIAGPGLSPAPRDDHGTGAQPGLPEPRRSRRTLLGLAAGALLVAAAAVGRWTAPEAGYDGELLARGVPEFTASLTEGAIDIEVQGSRAPEGRIVTVQSDTLPVLPLGEYYELWFVGPDDTPASPQRVSAGTFHPDYDDGTTTVVLHAAMDPTMFPFIEITEEGADGDPDPSPVVNLAGAVRLLDDRPPAP